MKYMLLIFVSSKPSSCKTGGGQLTPLCDFGKSQQTLREYIQLVVQQLKGSRRAVIYAQYWIRIKQAPGGFYFYPGKNILCGLSSCCVAPGSCVAVWSVLSVIATPFVYVLSDAASLFSDFNSHANAMSLQAKEITGTICSIIKIFLTY